MGFTQDDECGFVITDDQMKEYLEHRQTRAVNNYKKALDNAVIVFHVINKNDGTGGIDPALISTALADLNSFFSPVGFQFTSCKTNIINNTTYFNGTDLELMVNRYNSQKAINVYFIENSTSNAFLPGKGSDRIFMKNTQASNESTLSHEMGHYFGLLHTFGESTPSDYERVRRGPRPGSPCEPNWDTFGDTFEDTPADIHPKMLTATGSVAGSLKAYMTDCSHSVVSNRCKFTGFPGSDACGDDFMPDVKNIMSYSYPCCRDIFSADQISEMQAVRQDNGPAGRGYIVSNCSSIISPNCYDNVENGGEAGQDCGGPCNDPCPHDYSTTVYSDCESGCYENLILVCSAVSAEEYNGTIVISNAQVTNTYNYTVNDVEIRYSVVDEYGTQTILNPLFSSALFIDQIVTNQTVTAPAPIIYTPSQLSGLYYIRVQIVGTSNSCISTEQLAINYSPPVYPTCWDGIQNQGESGVDCGGPCPSSCPSCFDEIKNQGETNIDCGGPCTACPTCTDGVQNQGEVGIDCGGPCDPCDTCPDNLHLNQVNVADVYKADNTVSCDGVITVNNGSVIFNGGKKVDLLPGFLADANDGYYFEAENKDCDSNQKQAYTKPTKVLLDIPTKKETDIEVIDLSNIDLIDTKDSGFKIGNYPNPFSTETILELSLHQSDQVSIYINDLNGKLITKFAEKEFMTEGNYQFFFDGTKYQPGIYYYTVIVGAKRRTAKMILVK